MAVNFTLNNETFSNVEKITVTTTDNLARTFTLTENEDSYIVNKNVLDRLITAGIDVGHFGTLSLYMHIMVTFKVTYPNVEPQLLKMFHKNGKSDSSGYFASFIKVLDNDDDNAYISHGEDTTKVIINSTHKYAIVAYEYNYQSDSRKDTCGIYINGELAYTVQGSGTFYGGVTPRTDLTVYEVNLNQGDELTVKMNSGSGYPHITYAVFLLPND